MGNLGTPPASKLAERYRLGRVIGSGGVSIVLEAVDAHTGGFVAIKLLTAGGQVQSERFIREAKLASGLRSPHVVEVLDAGVDGDQPFIVMERLVGRDVGKLLADEGALPVATAVDVVLQTCDALARAHRAGIVHRDIKASNLFLQEGAEGPTVKVLDFGISKIWTRGDVEQTLTTNDGALLGSPPYMSPEQIRDPRAVDARTDIWSVGVVLHRLLTGRFPFGGDTTTSTLQSIFQAPLAPLASWGVSVPAPLEAALARCLERNVDERFVSVAELANALAPFASARFRPIAERVARISSTSRIDTRPSVRKEPTTMTFGATRPSAPPHSIRTMTTTSSLTPIVPPRMLTGERNPGATIAVVAASAALVVAMVGALGALGARTSSALAARRASMALEADAASPDIASSASAGAPSAAPSAASTCPPGMVYIDGGRFFMGSDDDLPAERPAHHVRLRAYCIDKREVTADAYKACSDRGDCKRAGAGNKWEGLTTKLARAYDPLCTAQAQGRGDHPVNCVDWSMADRFCKASGKRLPTEAEWEFAARGSDGRRYPWGDAAPSPKHLNACGPECALWLSKRGVTQGGVLYGASDAWPTTAPVGSFPLGASAHGVEDIVGNVWEWTADWYDAYPADDQVDPHGPEQGKTRVVRGGSWNGAYADWVRPTFRFHDAPETRSHGIGIRCAKSMEEER
ncbi:MAG: SUMF1/EgtB/PvdO family nonheme iron enzyme [Labilithrix sp.]|nr:SUMF1/EgtB/PvdO family nonheme iron enzyme [Labilithrix sp.]